MLFPLLGIVGFFLYIYIFQVDLVSIIKTASTANPLFYGAAIACGFIEILFFTLSWKALTNHLNIKMTLTKAYLYVSYALYVDIVIPAESISVTRDRCGAFGKTVASLFTQRLLGMAMNVIVLVVGVVLLTFQGQISNLVFNLIVFIAAGITGILIAMTILAFKRVWTLRLIDWATNLAQKISRGKWTLNRLREEAFQTLDHFHDGMVEYRHDPKPLATSLFYLAVTWFFSLSIPYLVFESLGHPVPWSIIIITAAIVLAVKSIPLGIPFEVGLPEATMTTLFIAMGVPAEISATATILTRIITLWLRFFVGFAAQQWLELKPVITPPTTDMEKTKNRPQQN